MTPTAPSRRHVLLGLAGAATLGALTACSDNAARAGASGAGASAGGTANAVLTDRIRAAEAARTTTGHVRDLALAARPAQVDLGGRVVTTWTYGGGLPGPVLRATAGDRLRIAFTNELPEATSVHWHGPAIRNDMDGVPGVTTPQVEPGTTFSYDFVVPDAGTHWFHPHHGMQLDRGLYAPLIIDTPDEKGDHDVEWILVLDDWTDGIGRSPEQIYADLTVSTSGTDGGAGHGMAGGMGGGMGGGMHDMAADGDVTYPLYLVNGRPTQDPDVLRARPGQRVRLRIVNAAADTIFTVALGGHRLIVTHTDGHPVVPLETSAVRIGMGERYDVVVTLADGTFPLVAAPSGKDGTARAVVATHGRPVRDGDLPGTPPAELSTRPLTADVLTVAEKAALPPGDPDTQLDLILAGTMTPYVWTVNGATYADGTPLTIHEGQAGRIRIRNHSMMSHPVHLHGHTFQLGRAGGTGARKDTLLLPPMAGADVDLVADNPGRWMLHCHNAYHAEAGMITRLDYLT